MNLPGKNPIHYKIIEKLGEGGVSNHIRNLFTSIENMIFGVLAQSVAK